MVFHGLFISLQSELESTQIITPSMPQIQRENRIVRITATPQGGISGESTELSKRYTIPHLFVFPPTVSSCNVAEKGAFPRNLGLNSVAFRLLSLLAY